MTSSARRCCVVLHDMIFSYVSHIPLYRPLKLGYHLDHKLTPVWQTSLYLLYYALRRSSELITSTGAHLRGATQLRRNVAAVASRGDTVSDLTGTGIKPHITCTDSNVFKHHATRLVVSKNEYRHLYILVCIHASELLSTCDAISS